MPAKKPQKKHELITADLVRKIQAGHWRASERLPSQQELASEYGVSLGTMQKCVKQLESEGLLVSVHGSGTYVTTDSPSGDELVIWRFRDETGRLMPIYSRVESVEICKERGPWNDYFGDDEAILISRRININLAVTARNEVYLRRSQFDFLLSMPLHRLDGHDLTRIIDRSGHGATVFEYRFSRCQLSDEIAAINQLPAGHIGLKWIMVGFTQRDQPIWYQAVEIPLSDYALEVHAHSPRRPSREPA